jgi:carbonic anhydrase
VFDRLLAANVQYAERFAHGDLGPTPRRHLAVVTCMDVRLDVYAMLGLELGDAHVIRNAGGRVTDDVLRSLIVSIEALGVHTVAVVQHTDCGMAKTTNAELRKLLRERRGIDAAEIDFLAIDDHRDAIGNDVAFLRSCPFLPPELDVAGFLYDVTSGRLTRIDQ